MSFLSNALGTNSGFTAQTGLPSGANFQNQDFSSFINNSVNNYQDSQAAQHQLTQQLLAESQGQGPNLANAQLQQATAQNVANQAALAAGQRGASQNVGLLSRQVGQQGANLQQQAAAQSSINALSQQLQAQGLLGQTAAQQGANANQQLGLQQGALTSQNSQILGATANANQANAQTAAANAQGNSGLVGGVLGGVSSVLAKKAEGGEIEAPKANSLKNKLPSAKLPEHLQRIAKIRYPHLMADGGELQSSGGDVEAPAPSQKAEKSGDSYSNDKIPVVLSEKEIVLPRSIAMSPNAPQMAYDFVSRIKAGHHRGKK